MPREPGLREARPEAGSARSYIDRAYRLFRDANRAIIAAVDESALFDQICRCVVANGYRMAWIGRLLDDASRSIKPVASAGFIEGYLDGITISWADNPYGRGVTGTAAREARAVVNQNFLTNPAMLPWRDAALRHGYQSSIAIPLTEAPNRVFAVLTLYATEPDAFVPEEVDALVELGTALSFGHEAILARGRRFEVLEKSVAALAATVESRDPYTAGHQSRVTRLAEAIATELGLDVEARVGVRLAALIHDIGKVHVPIEFLTTPKPLSDAERAVIRAHAEIGYQILKDIPFPWPVADMVRQHHERWDGSGYPQGLKGTSIVLGARILEVADVVEAIHSHRPYRIARGLAAALDEIVAQRGVLFDPDVVDACLRLFHDKGYAMSEAALGA